MDCDPQAVLSAAGCFLLCGDDDALDWIQIYLLCQIANS
jgi:hypothetical protein